MDLLTFSSKAEIISFQITNEKFNHFGIFQNEIVFLSRTEKFTHDSIVLLVKAERQYFGKLVHISDDLWCLNTALNEMLLFSQTEVTILGQVFSIAKDPNLNFIFKKLVKPFYRITVPGFYQTTVKEFYEESIF